MKKHLHVWIYLSAILIISGINTNAQVFHFQEGFADVPAGWSVGNTYRTTSSSNVHNEYDGNGAIKLKGVESFLETSDYETADSLWYWIIPYIEGASLKVEYSKDAGSTWTEVETFTPTSGEMGAYQWRKLKIDDEGNVRVKWTATGGADGDGLFYIDDIALTKIAAPADDASLSMIVIDSVWMEENFSSEVLDYEVSLPFGTTEVLVQAIANNPNAAINVDPPSDLEGTEAERTATITVTSEDETVTETYTIVFTISEYYLQEGFGNLSGDGNTLSWDHGWEAERTYTSSNNVPLGAQNLYPGYASVKFTGGHSTGGDNTDPGTLLSPKMTHMKTLKFWVALQKPIGGESLTIYLVKGNEKIMLREVTNIPETFQEIVVDINEADSAQILFESICDINDDSENRIWIDDLSITGDMTLSSKPSLIDEADIFVYPNPATDLLYFNLPEGEIDGIEVVNISGQKVIELKNVKSKSNIDISGLNTGVYFISIHLNSKLLTSKFIIQ